MPSWDTDRNISGFDKEQQLFTKQSIMRLRVATNGNNNRLKNKEIRSLKK
jgi:hypothetical protein